MGSLMGEEERGFLLRLLENKMRLFEGTALKENYIMPQDILVGKIKVFLIFLFERNPFMGERA